MNCAIDIESLFGAPRPFYHFSIDDGFESLIESTDLAIPLLEHPYIRFLNDLNRAHALQVGLHLFFEKHTTDGKLRTLQDVRSLANELADAGAWLRFGPHALNPPTHPHSQSPNEQSKVFDRIYAEIDRIAGPNSYSQCIRLHYYSESFELADYFSSRGVRALFSTDRPAGSYRMPAEIIRSLSERGAATYAGMSFVRTQYRVEFFANERLTPFEISKLFKAALGQYGFVILYTHEYELARDDVQEYLSIALDILRTLGVPSVCKT